MRCVCVRYNCVGSFEFKTSILTVIRKICFTGSLTDSICTAYENKMAKSINIDAKSHSSDGEKETAFAPMTNLTSMFGGKIITRDPSAIISLKHFLHNVCIAIFSRLAPEHQNR